MLSNCRVNVGPIIFSITSPRWLLFDGNGMMGGADVSNTTLEENETDDTFLLDGSISSNCLAREIIGDGEECMKQKLNSTGD